MAIKIGNLVRDTSIADDDYLLVDGASNGTRIIRADHAAEALGGRSTVCLKRAASYDESSSISNTDYIVVDNVTAPVRVSASNAATSLGQLATYPTGTGVAETEYILKIGANGKPQKVEASEAAAALAELAGQVAGAELLEQAVASGIVSQAMTNAITATIPQAVTQLKAELTESESAVEIFDAGLVVSERVKNDCLTSDSGYVLDARQGKVLQDGKIDKTSIADNLTTNDATKVLSAKQGKALQDGKFSNTGGIVSGNIFSECTNADASVRVRSLNSNSEMVNQIGLLGSSSGRAGVFDYFNNKWIIYSEPNGDVRLSTPIKGQDLRIEKNHTGASTATDTIIRVQTNDTGGNRVSYLDIRAYSDGRVGIYGGPNNAIKTFAAVTAAGNCVLGDVVFNINETGTAQSALSNISTKSARFIRFGKMVFASVYFQDSSNTVSGSGTKLWSVPTSCVPNSNNIIPCVVVNSSDNVLTASYMNITT